MHVGAENTWIGEIPPGLETNKMGRNEDEANVKNTRWKLFIS